ncbi:MAG TPA: class I adenylate-forming enzyme family protein [Solirubrobacteraceae bacterium]|jgi:acyl-CoA synthetase (AMP-forming)/AMP-acid ligase II
MRHPDALGRTAGGPERLARLDFTDAAGWTLSGLLQARAAETPDAVAIEAVGGQMSFAQWHDRAAALAGVLAAHLGALDGRRLLVWMGNDDADAFLIAAQAGLALGACIVPVDDRATAREVQTMAMLTRPAAVMVTARVLANLGEAGRAELALPDAPADQDAITITALRAGRGDGASLAVRAQDSSGAAAMPALATSEGECFVFFSSGSTGTPKGAAWDHGSLVQYAERAVNAIYALPRGGRPLTARDVLQSPIPVYTAAAIMENPYPALLAGCPVVYETGRFDPAASSARMTAHATTIYNAAPPHFAMLCDLPPASPPPDLELVVSGGSAFTVPLHGRIRARWPEVSIANWYGLMESGCGQTLHHGREMEADPGAIGRAVEPTELRVVGPDLIDVGTGEEGELWTRAPGQITGYLDNPEQTTARLHDGWLRSGDRASVDARGVVRLAGRIEERINRGGFKFYPVEIESVLEEDPAVREASVVAVPHEILGEVPIAFVVATEGSTIVPAQLRAHLRTRIAPNKVPAEILVRDELPRAAYGKVIRRALVREYLEDLERRPIAGATPNE